MANKVIVSLIVLFFSVCFVVKPCHGSSDVNIIVIWTDGPKLKAATLVCVDNERSGVVAVPRYIQLNVDDKLVSIEEFYYLTGRYDLISLLEEKFGITIHSYVSIDQKAVEYTSRILGEILVGEDTTTVVEAFEGTLQEIRSDDQAVVQALARRLFEPDAIVKIPYLTYVFMTNIETNLREREVLAVYRAIRHQGADTLRKRAVPGQDYYVDGKKYRLVEDEAWGQTIRNVLGY